MPNSIRPAAAVAIEHDGKTLMVQRDDSGRWTLPGGTLDFGESLPECAIREMREETGLQVELKEIVGTYTDANIRIAYSDGEVRQEFTVVYFGTAANHDVISDWESTAYSWVSMSELNDLPMADSQRRRIEDLLRYLSTGEKKIG
ncbi:MAG: NUDIX domain-containing protein [Coriobacteriaceae bacterium]|nr:NUDIX domain-containing protein [Coriobacteriaceae bacterium]MCI7439142.1 NUDIX domain-containing protein [Coriobacteriaceae bacterium]MDD7584508.1 NUDIX domain-containing protein [Coriobacteriaceae bacterium]